MEPTFFAAHAIFGEGADFAESVRSADRVAEGLRVRHPGSLYVRVAVRNPEDWPPPASTGGCGLLTEPFPEVADVVRSVSIAYVVEIR